MELPIEIKANDVISIIRDIFDSDTWEPHKTEKAVADGITIRCEVALQPLVASIDSQAFLQIALVVGKDVLLPITVTILSNYLYDKLKERSAKSIKIGDTYITQINVQQIYQTIIIEASREKDKIDN